MFAQLSKSALACWPKVIPTRTSFMTTSAWFAPVHGKLKAARGT